MNSYMALSYKSVRFVKGEFYIRFEDLAKSYSVSVVELEMLLSISAGTYLTLVEAGCKFLHLDNVRELDASVCRLRGWKRPTQELGALANTWYISRSAMVNSIEGLYILRNGSGAFATIPVRDSLAAVVVGGLEGHGEVVRIIPAPYKVALYASTTYLTRGALGKVPYSRNFGASTDGIVAECDTAIARATAALAANPDTVVGAEMVTVASRINSNIADDADSDDEGLIAYRIDDDSCVHQ